MHVDRHRVNKVSGSVGVSHRIRVTIRSRSINSGKVSAWSTELRLGIALALVLVLGLGLGSGLD